MEQRQITDAVDAACSALRNETNPIETELRQALENEEWIISFADTGIWMW